MNLRTLFILGAFAVTLGITAPLDVSAQISRPLGVLETNPDARTSALADVMGVRPSRMSLFASPVALFGNDRTFGAEVSGQIFPKIEGIEGRSYQVNAVAGYRLLDRHALSLSYRIQGAPKVSYFTLENPSAEPVTIRPFDWALDLSYGLDLGSGFMLSASGNVIASWIGKGAYTVSGSLGAFYHTEIDRTRATDPIDLSLGLKVNDLGSPITYKGEGMSYAVPASLQLGGEMGFTLIGKNHLDLLLGGRYFFLPREAALLTAGLGAEYDYDESFFVRAGYQFGQKDLSYVTLGAGAKVLGGLSLDLSYRIATSRLTGVNLWSLGASYEF